MYEDAKQIHPMGVWKLPKNKVHMRKEICNNGEYMAQLKKDGYWYTYEKTATGINYLFSRKENVQGYLSEKSANVPHLIEALDKALPNGTILATEIHYPGKISSDVTKIMGSLPEKAISRQLGDHGLISMYIHDILEYDGKSLLDKTNYERYLILCEVVKKHKLAHISPYIEIAKTWVGKGLDKIIDKAFDDGEEGVVLKRKESFFEPGLKPAWNWIKFKIEDNCDVFCIGFVPPTKEYEGKTPETWLHWEHIESGEITTDTNHHEEPEYVPVTRNYARGWIGAIRIGVMKNGEVADIGEVSAGLTDEMFMSLSSDQETYMNEPLLVRCMQPTEQKLRHSVFLNWRDDINMKDCTWEKIFEE